MSRSKEKHHSREHAENIRQETGTKEEPAERDPAGPDPSPAIPVAQDGTPAVDLPGAKAAPLEKLPDQLLRLRADFDNFRKRTLREKNELYDMAASELILELLPVLDHLQLGIQAAIAHKADQAIQKELQLIFD